MRSPWSSEDILENRGGRAGVSLLPVQPQQALLAVAWCPVRPGPSGAATKLNLQSRGSPDFTSIVSGALLSRQTRCPEF